jgi:hypothetical protein
MDKPMTPCNENLNSLKTMKTQLTVHLMAALIGVVFTAELMAQPTAFTYQGQLTENGVPATGFYDLEFTLYDSSGGVSIVGGPLTNNATAVSNGLFTVTLDFGFAVFDGNDRWLEIRAVTNGGGAFTTLSPRQQITSTPYAIRAGNLTSGGLSSTYSEAVTFNNPSNVFVGDGSSLSGIHSLDAADGAPTDAVFVNNTGSVGVGTVSPQVRLHVQDGAAGLLPNSNARLVVERNNSTWINILAPDASESGVLFGNPAKGSAAAGVVFNSSATTNGLQFRVNGNSTKMVIEADGDVGIGTTSPQGRLHVVGPTVVQGLIAPPASSATNLLNLGSGNTSDGFRNGISFFETASVAAMSLGYDGAGGSAENALRIHHSSGIPLFTFEASGELGIGTNKPAAPLHATGIIRSDTQVSVGTTAQLRATESGSDGADLLLRDAVGQITINLDAEGGGGGSTLTMANGNGVTTVNIDADQTDAAFLALMKGDGSEGIVLDADNGTVGGSLVAAQVMRITGGADIAEPFQISGTGLEPGMVVSIDPSQPGGLMLSNTEYDRKVAGIISGAGGVRAGLMLGQQGSIATGNYPVALTGRVYCWCDSAYGKIEPGDMLTTSPVPGHAMKVTDHGRSQGAVLGKAMSSLNEGCGLVLVLVNLH